MKNNNLNTEKISFGKFLAECRTKKGLTQKELADKLFVGESAVSKWEKDKRRPDLELVSRLAEIFGITESELIRASIDTTRQTEKQQARKFRIISNVYNFILFIGFGTALLTCFIVNLAVSHTLSWFFIVLCAIVVASVILILPQYVKKHKLLIVPLSWLASLYLLLGVVCIYTGGNWFLIPMFALLLAYSIIFAPLLIREYLPQFFKNHNAIFSIALDVVLTFVMLLIIDLYTAQNGSSTFGWSGSIGLPTLAFWLVPTFATVVVSRYVKINKAFKTSAVVAIWLVAYNIFESIVDALIGIEHNGGNFWQANLFDWSTSELINSNVILLTNIAILTTAVVFAVVGFTNWHKSRKTK